MVETLHTLATLAAIAVPVMVAIWIGSRIEARRISRMTLKQQRAHAEWTAEQRIW